MPSSNPDQLDPKSSAEKPSEEIGATKESKVKTPLVPEVEDDLDLSEEHAAQANTANQEQPKEEVEDGESAETAQKTRSDSDASSASRGDSSTVSTLTASGTNNSETNINSIDDITFGITKLMQTPAQPPKSTEKDVTTPTKDSPSSSTMTDSKNETPQKMFRCDDPNVQSTSAVCFQPPEASVCPSTAPIAEKNIEGEETEEDLYNKVLESLQKLNTVGGSGPYGLVANGTKNKLMSEIVDPSSVLYKELEELKQNRFLWCEPPLPMEKPQNCKQTLRIAAWNAGKTVGDLIRAVFAVLMNILKMDIILVQEIKGLDFKTFLGNEAYHITCLPPVSSTGTLKRGLFIMYRIGSTSSMFNPMRSVGGNCPHPVAYNVENRNVEICSVDVSMTNSVARRLLNIYHTSQVTEECVPSLKEVLQPIITKVEGVLIGDTNLRLRKVMDRRNAFLKLMEGWKWNNILPKEWQTHSQTMKNDDEKDVNVEPKEEEEKYIPQPDIIYSNVDQRNILVHKPIIPMELVRKICSQRHKLKTSGEQLTKKTIELWWKYERRKKPASEYHYILIVELGEGVNSGTEVFCCPDGIPHAPKEKSTTKYHCSPPALNQEFLDMKCRFLDDAMVPLLQQP